MSEILGKFDYESYRQLLKLITNKNKNVCFADFPLPSNTPRYFILRHDVDFSPEFALGLAKFEAKLGIRATYFLLLTSPYYNLLSKEFSCFASQLVSLGHNVGLHYDLSAYTTVMRKNPDETMKFQLEILSRLAGVKIKSISMHMPSYFNHGPFHSSKEVLNAYDDCFTKKIAYFSDSCGEWRDETVKIFSSGQIPEKFQLLTHPIFWGKQNTGRYEKLGQFTTKQNKKLHNEAEIVKKMWVQHTKNISK